MEKNKESIWVYCPVCRQKTRVKVTCDTVLIKFPLYCPKCKEEHIVNIIDMKMDVLE